ncbi:Zn(II)2Cys6 transcription factor [Aspergillus brunneoviolaceus CBS 621.78]|uniref:Uncharacterized protein n=1 Tax=Aspergillus brunneoviolaceus CBS 621.78 TaxID=1450534 RepID=A0ACD1G988_9EURO|nr:hypothetical protein BO95DRAFT_473489 [Aspergillus brunneoviolaceus CBS 621.78]RAH45851.1 hypothetical protein BO95DRAFT_473489 [Aspergillus brunneoviolaceus CBS 621.78]
MPCANYVTTPQESLRSCASCRRRKVKCDRQRPSANCARTKHECGYPPGRGRAPKCTVPNRTRASQPVQPGVPPAEGLLVQDGASTRYIDEVLFAHDNDIQSAISSPGSIDASSQQPFDTCEFDGLISNPMPASYCRSPSRKQATQLWQVNLNNADPLLKLLHIPSVNSLVFAAINNPEEVTAGTSALLFAIDFAAVTSLPSPDTILLLNQDRPSALNQIQRGLEISLHAAVFLDSPTITTLQAMTIYLATLPLTCLARCRRGHSGGRSGWALDGLLIRSVQSIGLHRDPEHIKLTPLKCELRRRMCHGLSTGWVLPLNADDKDICAKTDVAPIPGEGWTEMKLNGAFQRASRLSVGVLNSQNPMDSLEQLSEHVQEKIEAKYLRYCDPNIPLQKAAILLSRVFLGKLSFIIRQQYLGRLRAEKSTARAVEEAFALAYDTLSLSIELKEDELLSSYQWHFTTYPQYHLLTYTLWQHYVRPDVPRAERAWELVNKSFSMTELGYRPSSGPKWNALRRLRERALSMCRVHQAARIPAVDAVNTEADNTLAERLSDEGLDEAFRDDILWDLDSVCFPDWSTFALAL